MKVDGVLLVSGGMDSTVLAYDLVQQGKTIIPLFIDYGQHCREKEYSTANRVLPKEIVHNLKVINISDVYSESNSRMIKEADLWRDNVVSDDLYLPYRNLLFLSVAAAYAQSLGADCVYSAFINSNHAKEIDCSLNFFLQLQALLKEFGSVEIRLPYRDLSKTEVARLGLSLSVPISETYSCQVNSTVPCGVCPNCIDRLTAINSVLDEYLDKE